MCPLARCAAPSSSRAVALATEDLEGVLPCWARATPRRGPLAKLADKHILGHTCLAEIRREVSSKLHPAAENNVWSVALDGSSRVNLLERKSNRMRLALIIWLWVACEQPPTGEAVEQTCCV
eukprot:CAMPEP_0119339936 /NCGR_PEP_ID=MMETSP1333-20130426/99365_1 /TAXON_ID=418940 /ORGANISM="Scyphosphaera apsteinii, Strain RCC1455" /LENGTH=121 /DNA_ID=CAMNT_0007351573 /DNA_START=362 /DNA_END=731 /DNA_ORIENTATION=+